MSDHFEIGMTVAFPHGDMSCSAVCECGIS